MGSSEFDVFISYARSVSTPLAVDLQRDLERFAKKWNQVRAIRVFRDDASMSANAGLWSTIEAALTAARYFILIATPESAASEYVGDEVRWWLEHKGPQSILLVLAGGHLEWSDADGGFTADSAVPPVLRKAFPEEPRWIDMTWYGQPDSAGSDDPRFEERVADLAAPVRGVDRDALIGANLAEHRKTMRRARIAIVTLAALLVAAMVAGGVAVVQRNTAKKLFADAVGQRIAPDAARILNGEIPGGLGRGLQETLVAQLLKIKPDPGAYLNAMVATTEVEKIGIIAVDGAALSPTLIATGNHEHPGEIHLWDTDLKPVVEPIQTGNNSYPRSFSHDGRLLAVANDEGVLELWNLDTRTRRISTRFASALGPKNAYISNVVFTPDDKGLVVRTGDNTVRFLSADTLQETAPAIPNTAWIVAPGDGNIVAVAPLRGDAVEIRDPVTGAQLGEPLPNTGGVLFFNDCRAFDQTGDRLLVQSQVFDVKSRSVIGKSTVYTGDCLDKNVTLSPDGTLAMGGGDSIQVGPAASTDPSDPQISAGLLSSGGPFLRVGWLDNTHAMAISPNGILKLRIDPVELLKSRYATNVAFGARDGDMAVQQDGGVIGYRGDTAWPKIPGALAGAREGSYYTLDPSTGAWDGWSFQDGSHQIGLSLLLGGDTVITNLTGDTGLHSIVAQTGRGTVGGTLRRWDVASGRQIGNALSVPEDVQIQTILDLDGAQVTAFARDAKMANDEGSIWVFDFDTGTAEKRHAFSDPVATAVMCRDQAGTPTWMIAEKSGGIGFAKGPLGETIPWTHPPSVQHESFRGGDLSLSNDCRTGMSWASGGTLQFWDVDSGSPLGNPIPKGVVLGDHDAKVVFKVEQSVLGGFRVMPQRPTAEDLCAKLVSNISRQQWNTWVSPDIPYQKACPDLPVQADG